MSFGTGPGSQWVVKEKEGDLFSATLWESLTFKCRDGTADFLRVIIADAWEFLASPRLGACHVHEFDVD